MTASDPVGNLGRCVEINGARLYYEEQGAGDPLLLLHGGLTSSASWAGVIPRLATRFRVIAPDSRGHGHSSNPAGRMSYGAIAEDTVGLIGVLELERSFIAGWSDGGQVALEIGLRAPDIARALVVGAAFFDFGEGFRESVRATFGIDASGAIDVGRIEAALGASLPGIRAIYPGDAEAWAEFLRQTVQMWLEYPGLTEDDFRRIQTPSLVIAGDRDDFVPVEVAAAMSRMLANAELAICPHAGHDLPSTHATWFVETVLDFLGRQAAAGVREPA